MKRPLVGITFAFGLGILSEELLNIPIFYIFLFVLIFLFLSMLSINSKKQFLLLAVSGFFFLGAFNYKNSISLPKDHIKNVISINQELSQHVLVQGLILNRPNKRTTYFNQDKYEFLLGVKYMRLLRPDFVGARNDGGEWQTACGILSAQVMSPRFDFKYGQEVILEGDLSLPDSATNPGQFDYRKYLERKKIFYILKVKENNFSKIIGRPHLSVSYHKMPNLLKQFAYTISERIEALIDRFSPTLEGSILNAILLGERRDIPKDINDNFFNTGTVHILSISGLHVGLLVSIFILLFKLLRLPFKFWTFLLTFLLILYCAMVDNRPPVIRSAIMILIFLFGRVLRREQDLLNSLAFSALVILFFNPQDLFDIGFQLSFLTMGSIVYFPPKLDKMQLPMNKAKLYFIRAIVISFSAWLGSAPFIARYFNIVSPITIVANLLVVPWMFFVLASSLIFIIFGLISSLFGLVFSEVASLSILILAKMVHIFSRIPFSYLRVKSPSWVFIMGFYIFLSLFFNRRYIKLKAKYFLIAALVSLNIFVWRSIFFERSEALQISFLDVGNGDSIFLEFPKSGTMLIDGGEGMWTDMGRLVVTRFLSSKGINKIDVVMATHPHTDHIGGLVPILKNFKVRYFIDNGDKDVNLLYRECQDLVKQKGLKRFVVKRGDSIKGFEGITILVLNPPAKKFYDLNNNSLVLKLKYKDFSVLFCADIKEEAAKDLLLNQDEKLSSTVLKVPHHGGALGDAVYKFIKKINPKLAVISVGARDVNKDVLEALTKLQAHIYRTDKDGAISLITKKDKYSVLTFSAKNIDGSASGGRK